jgi:hypothetical protein
LQLLLWEPSGISLCARHGFSLGIHGVFCHASPIVSLTGAKRRVRRCELADLLMAIDVATSGRVIWRTTLVQAKRWGGVAESDPDAYIPSVAPGRFRNPRRTLSLGRGNASLCPIAAIPRYRAVFNPSASSARQPGSGRGVAVRGWPEHCSARGPIVQPEVTGSCAVGRALSPRIVRPSLPRTSIDAEGHDRHRQPSKPPVSTGARPEGTPAGGTSGTGCVRCAGGCGGGGCRPAFPAATVPSIPSCKACAIIGRLKETPRRRCDGDQGALHRARLAGAAALTRLAARSTLSPRAERGRYEGQQPLGSYVGRGPR